MKYLLILGRGIEGCGNTRNAIELENYIKEQGHECVSISNKDASVGRSKAHEHNINIVSFANKFDNVLSYINNCDKIVIISVPPKKVEKQSKDNFLKAIEYAHQNGKKITYLQFDHKSHSISRNMYVESDYISFFNNLDLVITHSYDNDFVKKFLVKNKINVNLVARNEKYNNFFSIDFDSLKPLWKSFADKEHKSIRFLGRSAAWKGPYLLRELHWNHFKPADYITYIEGIEMSIGVLGSLFTEIKPNKIEREDNIVLCLNKKNMEAFNKGEYKFERNAPAYILPPYLRNEGLERMSKTMFGCELILMDDYIAKDMIENAMLEIVACGSIPIFRKHWAELFKINGIPLAEYDGKEIGTILIDEDNPTDALKLMNEISCNEELYETYRNNAYNFYKSIFDNSVILKQLVDLIDNA